MSTLSSVIDDSADFSEATRRTEKILSDYVPISAKDNTVTLLQSFLEVLPTSGRVQLMEDIEHAKSKLHQLCQYLYGGIIAPCKYS
jgi:hypothetical protein